MTARPPIIFDLDGTLIDSRPEIAATYQRVCEAIPPAQPPALETLNYGATLPSILSAIYGNDGEKIAAARERFVAIYDQSDYKDTLLYPQVMRVLDALHTAGFPMHIATNKRLTPTKKILAAKGILKYFQGIISSDVDGAALISKTQMVQRLCQQYAIGSGYMVGDADTDIEAGHLCGLFPVAVLYGYEKKEKLLEKNPKFVIHQFSDLHTLLLSE